MLGKSGIEVRQALLQPELAKKGAAVTRAVVEKDAKAYSKVLGLGFRALVVALRGISKELALVE